MRWDSTEPFPHLVFDCFFNDPSVIAFPRPDDPCWFRYDNALERKLACADWHKFPNEVYAALHRMLDPRVVSTFSQLVGEDLIPDFGLHGGGMHCHVSGGKLNPHLDYDVHPKIKRRRTVNLIVYLTPGWKEKWGGHFGMWKDGVLVKEVAPLYNRAVVFDTRGSWHGLSRPVTCPDGESRRSLAAYYVSRDRVSAGRGRALFAPTQDQVGDESVLKLIEERSK